MIPNDHKAEAEIFSNAEIGSEFVIHQNAAMFNMLSDGLYSDKVGAIVRELSCNAYDSHIEAGCEDRPIEITVPTVMHHQFAVEDFGIGMNEETVRSVFAGYFNSSKRNNNDVTGAFGLGSKTPFIFNDTFTVRARKDGVERIFTAYMKDGIPHLSKTAENACVGVSDGVKIIVPVSPDHAQRFLEAVQDKLKWFKTAPIIVNRDDITIEPKCVDLPVGEAVSVYHYGSIKLTVLMGNVAYPVSFQSIGVNHSEAYLARNWVLRVPMGSVSITPSRESLSLDDATIKTLHDMFMVAYDKDVDRNWVDVIKKSYDRTHRRMNMFNLIKNVRDWVGLLHSRPESKRGYHKLYDAVTDARALDHSATRKALHDFINIALGRSEGGVDFPAQPKLMHRKPKDVFLYNTCDDAVGECQVVKGGPHIANLTCNSAAHWFVFDDLPDRICVRKIHIVSHETLKTKPTMHAKVMASFIGTKDLSLDVCNRDAVVYIPVVLTDKEKHRIRTLASRLNVDPHQQLVFHGLDALRDKMLPEIRRAREEKMAAELERTHRDETLKKSSEPKNLIRSQNPLAIVKNRPSSSEYYDLNASDVLYLTVDKATIKEYQRASIGTLRSVQVKDEGKTLHTLARLLMCINGDDRILRTIVKHGNNSKKIEECNIQSLEGYVTTGLNRLAATKSGCKKLNELGEYIAITDITSTHAVRDIECVYVKAVADGHPTGKIAGIYNNLLDIKKIRGDMYDQYGNIDDINISALVVFSRNHVECGDGWIEDAHRNAKKLLNDLKRVQTFFSAVIQLPSISTTSWGGSINISVASHIIEIVKQSACYIEDQCEESNYLG